MSSVLAKVIEQIEQDLMRSYEDDLSMHCIDMIREIKAVLEDGQTLTIMGFTELDQSEIEAVHAVCSEFLRLL